MSENIRGYQWLDTATFRAKIPKNTDPNEWTPLVSIHECRFFQDRMNMFEDALRLIATPMRPDGTWNRDRQACQELAVKALEKANGLEVR